MVVFIISFIVYLITIYIGYKCVTNLSTDDLKRVMTVKERVLSILWMFVFLLSQVLWISEIFKFLGIGVE